MGTLGGNAESAAVAEGRAKPRGLPFGATVYLAVVVAAAVVAALPALQDLSFQTPGWTTFLLLTGCAAVAQLFTVRTKRNYAYHTTGVFLVAGALLLPAGLVALMPLALRAPDWARRRVSSAVQAFNVAAYTLAALAAYAAAHFTADLVGGRNAEAAAAGLVAMTLLVAVQAGISASMVALMRRCSIFETGIFTTHGLTTELVLAALGVAVAGLWTGDPWLVPFALAPLLVVQRSLVVPKLEEEARVDPKTGLFNARHFNTALEGEFGRAQRFVRPLSVLMADLDLLRDVNNTYGHLAGDAVLDAVAHVLRQELRDYDVPARFGGEEFAILLPETGVEEAAEIAERIRCAVASAEITVDTAPRPIHITTSIGVAAYPMHADDGTGLVYQADVAVYRAKVQGRNRVVIAGHEGAVVWTRPTERPRAVDASPFGLSVPTTGVVPPFVTLAGILGGAAAMVFGTNQDLLGMMALVGVVALVQVLADAGRSAASVSAVGLLAGAALFGPRIALPTAVVACVVEWGRTRMSFARLGFDIGTLTLAALAAAGVFALPRAGFSPAAGQIAAGLVAGGVYFVIAAAGPLALAANEAGAAVWAAIRATLGWILLQDTAAGLLAGVVAICYGAAGRWTLALIAVALLLARATQDREAARAQRMAAELSGDVETLEQRNASLTQANEALREHSTAMVEALTAMMDERESAGHSREVQRLAVAIGSELRLSAPELDVLSQAALLHDVGKLAVPDSVLLKDDALTEDEWEQLREHAPEGARLVSRLAYLRDAVPAIRHHHERYDGLGYPDGLAGDEIPLGARIIHVAEATVSMLTPKPEHLSEEAVLAELRRCAGTQFCPRCVKAVASLAAAGLLEPVRRPGDLPVG
ncbi:MAG TPA: diguanylate cyclase [Gaiellaceae bacterium]|nr:diguanylate cyclase [Gaiellaceae bacterium]